MQQIIQTHLQSKVYNPDDSQGLSKLIAEEIKTKLIGKKKLLDSLSLALTLLPHAKLQFFFFLPQLTANSLRKLKTQKRTDL